MKGQIAATTILCAISVLPPAAAAETLAVNGVELTMVSEGEGTPVLFIHGAISDHRVWEPYRERIAGTHRFIAYDQRYFGTADWADEAVNFSVDTHVDDLIKLLETLEAPAHVVTWSYSGDVATRAAIMRPDLFRSMIHYEPYLERVLSEVPGSARANGAIASSFGPAMAAVEAKQPEESALRLIEAVFNLPEGAADSEPEPARSIWRENGRTVLPYLQMPMGEQVTCASAAEIAVPTLIVQGGEADVTYAMIAEALAACQRNAIVLTLPGVNHDGPYRKPDEFGEMITQFIALVE